jgi:inositol phosphorylceramide mannosyltransferase catalytic subunit
VIPRIIHQIYLTGDLPAVLARNVEELKSLNPAWEHRLWNSAKAERFIRESYGEMMLHAFCRIDPRYGAVRADFLRHLILGVHGGVYFDIKSGAMKPLDQTIREDDEYLLSQWPAGHPLFHPHKALRHVVGGEFAIFFLASRPCHPFSSAMIDRIVRNIRAYRPWSSVGRTGALKLGGPIAFTLTIAPLLKQHQHRRVTFEEMGLYPSIEYDHYATFPQHYSRQTAPVVQLGPFGRRLSRAFGLLRESRPPLG